MKAALPLIIFMSSASLAAGEICVSGSVRSMTPQGFLAIEVQPKLEALGYDFVPNTNKCGKVESNVTLGASDDGRPSATFLYSWQLVANNGALSLASQTGNAEAIAAVRSTIEASFPKLACRTYDGHNLLVAAPEKPFVVAGGVVTYVVSVLGDQRSLASQQKQVLATVNIDSCEDS